MSWPCTTEKALQARPAEILEIAASFFSTDGATSVAAQALSDLGTAGWDGFTGEMAIGFGNLVTSVGQSLQAVSVSAGQAQAACQAAGRTLDALEAESDALFVTAGEQQAELDALSAEAAEWETTVYWRGRAVSVAASQRDVDPVAYDRAVQRLWHASATVTRLRTAAALKRAELNASQVVFDRIRDDEELAQSGLAAALADVHDTLGGNDFEFSAADIGAVATMIDIFDLAYLSLQVDGPAAAAARNALLDARLALATTVGLPIDASALLVGLAGAAWDGVVDPLFDYLTGDALNWWNGGDDGFPWGKLAAGALRAKRLAGHVFTDGAALPVFNNGAVGARLAALLSRFPASARTGAWLTGATPFFTKVGIVGGTLSTGLGAWNLYQQGNPIEALRSEGAGYVADIGSTTFAASSTLLLLAPGAAPVLVPIAVGAAIIWAGAEVWDAWGDDISAWTGERWDEFTTTTSAVWDAGTRTVVSTWNNGVESIEQTWDVTTTVADATWNAGSEFVTDTGESLADIRDSAVEAGTEFVYDVGNTAVDVGGTVLDAGGDVLSKADPRNWF